VTAFHGDLLAVRHFLAALFDEGAHDRRLALARRKIVALPPVGAEACLEGNDDRICIDPQLRVGVRIGEDPVALHEAGAVDEEGEDHRLAEHHHCIVPGHGIGVPRRASDVLEFVIVSKPDLAQARGLRAAPLELLEAADAQSRRTAVGPAGRIDEFLLRQLADGGSKLQVPDSRQRLLAPRGVRARASQDQSQPGRHDG